MRRGAGMKECECAGPSSQSVRGHRANDALRNRDAARFCVLSGTLWSARPFDGCRCGQSQVQTQTVSVLLTEPEDIRASPAPECRVGLFGDVAFAAKRNPTPAKQRAMKDCLPIERLTRTAQALLALSCCRIWTSLCIVISSANSTAEFRSNGTPQPRRLDYRPRRPARFRSRLA